ncbi:MAG: heme exporter protein CcmB, partial [Myxococcales bacterium]|nr:heme exporter protein CcmB [Myxococcales bacterium]
LLSPISRAALYAGKAIAALILLLLNATILTCFVTILCHLSPFISENPARNIGFMAIFILAGLIGFVAPGTLFASMSVRTKIRELTLSIILFPLCAPALLVGVVATRELFVGAPDLELWNWLRVLVAFDLVVVAICPMLFERLFSSRS